MLEVFAISATLKSLLPRARGQLLCIHVFVFSFSPFEESRTVLPVSLLVCLAILKQPLLSNS